MSFFEYKGFRFGFFCSTSDGKITTNRKFQLKNLTEDKVLRTFELNLSDFKKLLDISKEMGLSIFRLGSNIVPFMSHPEFKREWIYKIEEYLKNFSKILKEYNIRITMHPGQFVVLNSPYKKVVDSSLRELEYHFWVLDTLDLGKESIVVIHAGGVYGDKKESLLRFKNIIRKNPWLLKRIAVENDEKNYTVKDILELRELNIPIVYDHYHNMLNPSIFDSEEIVSSWSKMIPEFHLSSKPNGNHKFGEHGDLVKVEDFIELYNIFKNKYEKIDLIIEAKAKEKAISRLIGELKNLNVF